MSILDFWTSLPEALHQVTITMSDRGIPHSYRHMDGFGSHTFSLINAKNERFWINFHLKTKQGIKNLTDEAAEAIVGKDRESHQRDLFESIEKGDFPGWNMKIQAVPEKETAAPSATSPTATASGGSSRISGSRQGLQIRTSARVTRGTSGGSPGCEINSLPALWQHGRDDNRLKRKRLNLSLTGGSGLTFGFGPGSQKEVDHSENQH